MKVYQLNDDEKKILAGFTEEQQKIAAMQTDLYARIKTALDAFSAKTGLKQPLAISECGNFVVEATRASGRPDRIN